MSWLPLPSWRRILGFVLKQCTKCQASEVLRLCVAEMSAYDRKQAANLKKCWSTIDKSPLSLHAFESGLSRYEHGPCNQLQVRGVQYPRLAEWSRQPRLTGGCRLRRLKMGRDRSALEFVVHKSRKMRSPQLLQAPSHDRSNSSVAYVWKYHA